MAPVPTRRLVAALAVASLVVLVVPVGPPIGLLVADGVILGLALIDALLALDPATIRIQRRLPSAVTIGAGGAEVAWVVHNPTARRANVAVADSLAPSLRAGARRFRVHLPPRASVTTRTRIDPSRRGRFEPTEIVVRVDGRLGLGARQRRRQQPGVMSVLPAFRSRAEAELRIERARRMDVGLRSAKGRGGGTEFDALREYTVDDESRRMDWAATARANKPVVRTYRAERNQQVIVLLDNGRLMAGQVDGVPRIELAMDAVMMLTAVASRLGDRCGLVAFDREVRAVVPPAQGTAQLGRVIQAMYDLEPRLVESDYLGAFATTLARFRRRAMLVLVTELSEEAVSETLIPALPLLLAHHLVVVASVADPDVVRWSRATPAEPSGAYRTAAAVSALQHRDHTASRLRGLGATVVDAPPGALSSQLAETYLQVKATGRL